MKKRKSVESNYCLRNIDVFYIFLLTEYNQTKYNLFV